MSVISEEDCKVFCSNCNRTIKEGKSNLKVSQPFCYHLVHRNQTVMMDDNSEHLNKVAEHFHKEDGHIYKVLKCTERTN